MIVNYTNSGWEVITQRAHGLLAAQIAIHWRHTIRTSRCTETLLAVAEHDDTQVELDGITCLPPQGEPVDFKMKEFEQRHCTRTMDFALSKSHYIALCAMHLEFVYGRECAGNPEAAKFMHAQKLLQSQWRKELKLTVTETQRDYRLLEWCDALSLLLCQHENQPEARAISIRNGPDKKDYRLIQSGPGRLTVDPWPFERERFELYFERRAIPQLSFKNAAEFRSAFLGAPVTEKRWVFQKERPPANKRPS